MLSKTSLVTSLVAYTRNGIKEKGKGGIKMNDKKGLGLRASLVEIIDLTGEFMGTEGGPWAQGGGGGWMRTPSRSDF